MADNIIQQVKDEMKSERGVGDDFVEATLMNPYYCINIAKGLATTHTPLVSKSEWIHAQLNLLEELGPENYFKKLLSVLEGNYTKSNTVSKEPT